VEVFQNTKILKLLEEEEEGGPHLCPEWGVSNVEGLWVELGLT